MQKRPHIDLNSILCFTEEMHYREIDTKNTPCIFPNLELKTSGSFSSHALFIFKKMRFILSEGCVSFCLFV